MCEHGKTIDYIEVFRGIGKGWHRCRRAKMSSSEMPATPRDSFGIDVHAVKFDVAIPMHQPFDDSTAATTKI
jgi:hypothetical protein